MEIHLLKVELWGWVMYIFSHPWVWVSKLLSHNVGVGHFFLSNPFFKSSGPTPPPPHPLSLFFLTTPSLGLILI